MRGPLGQMLAVLDEVSCLGAKPVPRYVLPAGHTDLGRTSKSRPLRHSTGTPQRISPPNTDDKSTLGVPEEIRSSSPAPWLEIRPSKSTRLEGPGRPRHAPEGLGQSRTDTVRQAFRE